MAVLVDTRARLHAYLRVRQPNRQRWQQLALQQPVHNAGPLRLRLGQRRLVRIRASLCAALAWPLGVARYSIGPRPLSTGLGGCERVPEVGVAAHAITRDPQRHAVGAVLEVRDQRRQERAPFALCRRKLVVHRQLGVWRSLLGVVHGAHTAHVRVVDAGIRLAARLLKVKERVHPVIFDVNLREYNVGDGHVEGRLVVAGCQPT